MGDSLGERLGVPRRDGFGVELMGPLMPTTESTAVNSTSVESTWEVFVESSNVKGMDSLCTLGELTGLICVMGDSALCTTEPELDTTEMLVSASICILIWFGVFPLNSFSFSPQSH